MKYAYNFLGLFLATGLTLSPITVKAADAKADAKPYPLTKCIVSGEKLGGDMGKPYVFVYQDREIKMCCEGCKKDFDKDTPAFIKKLVAAEKEAAAKHPYPLKTCLVSGDKLGGDQGKPYEFVNEDQEIKLCCKDCLKEFKKNTAKYMKLLAAAKPSAKN